MINYNYIIPRHERSAFDVIADACWCVLHLLDRDYPCYRHMYGDPEWYEDGPSPRNNPHIKKLGSSEDPKKVLECLSGILQDGISNASKYDLSYMTEQEFHDLKFEGYETNEEWEKYIKQ